MKGKWLIALSRQVLNGSTKGSDAASIVSWQLRQRETSVIEDLAFSQADRVLWSLITEILIQREYGPPGFDICSSATVVEMGAHQGTFAGFAARRTRGQIIAVEPIIVFTRELGKVLSQRVPDIFWTYLESDSQASN